jgi:hypothetical protein
MARTRQTARTPSIRERAIRLYERKRAEQADQTQTTSVPATSAREVQLQRAAGGTDLDTAGRATAMGTTTTYHLGGDMVNTVTEQPGSVKGVISYDPNPVPKDEEHPDLLSDITPATFDVQNNSPLFTKLPTEVRHEIFRIVLAQYDATSRPYPKEAFYYRPGCMAPKCIDTAILYTCRRVLYEARYIPLQTAVHEFWGSMPAPPHTTMDLSPSLSCPRGLTQAHITHTRDFHVYGDYCFLTGRTRNLIWMWSWYPEREKRCRPRSVTMTIPHTGWMNWEYGVEPMILDDTIEDFFKLKWPDSIEELRIRFETLEIFAEELHTLVDRLVKYKVPLSDMDGMDALVARRMAAMPSDRRGQIEPTPPPWTFLSAEGIVPRVEKWTGPHSEELKQRWESPIEHVSLDVSELWYYVVEATWRKV